jgi:Aspartyl/Asparaginyl beta-hydroxylase
MTEHFKILGDIDHYAILKQLSPRIEYMRNNNLMQYGMLGRTLDDGSIDYGEGRTKCATRLQSWDVWRDPEDNTGPFAELLARLHEYRIGRTRIMRMASKVCYSWHMDETPRIHVPLITNLHAFLIVSNESKHLSEGKLWYVDTTKPHTAMNCGDLDRYHLVVEII